MFFHGQVRSLGDRDRSKTILDADRDVGTVLDRFDEFADFITEGLHVAFQEEEQRFIFRDTFLGADSDVGFSVIVGSGSTLGTENFHALVITVNSLAAVIDNADRAVLEFQGNNSGVDNYIFSSKKTN